MRKGIFAAIFFGLLGIAAIPALAQSQQPPMPAAPMGGMGSGSTGGTTSQPSAPLKITYGDKSATWTPATLAALPHTTVTVYNEHAKANETYAGVQLIDLLTPLGVAEKSYGKGLRLYVVAAGSDGYEVVYSIGEVTPFINDSTVIVADSKDGKGISDGGPLQLVATREKRPARWVRNLVAIRVLAAE
jgi:hypothetical protein